MPDPIKKLSPAQVAFVEELTSAQGPMRVFCNSIMIGSRGVDDVLQEANRVILEKADDFTPGTNFRAWAFSIVRFQAMAYFKRHKRENKLLFNTEIVGALQEKSLVQNKTEFGRKMSALNRCLDELRPADFRLVGKRYWSDATLGEYAKEIGKTSDALKRSLFRIRKRLRACVEKRLLVEGGQ